MQPHVEHRELDLAQHARPLWKFFAASILSNSSRGSGAPVSTWRVMWRSTSHSQQKFSMNWLGSSTASHSTPLMPETPSSSTRVSRWCRPWPNSWNSVMHFVVREERGLAADTGAEKLQVRYATGVCSAVALRRRRDRIVHPGAAALAFRARTGPDRTGRRGRRRVAHVEKAHIRVPHRRLRRDGSVPDTAFRATLNSPPMHRVLGEVLLHLLFGERVALLPAASRRRRRRPRAAGRQGRARSRRTRAAPCQSFSAKGARAVREVLEEGVHLLGRFGHLRHERDFGEVRDSRAAALSSRAQREDARDVAACCPIRACRTAEGAESDAR